MSAPLFDPTAAPVSREVKIAPRPLRLDGLRIGLVENTKFNSDVLLRRLADRLGRRHGMTLARMVRKRSPSHEVGRGRARGAPSSERLRRLGNRRLRVVLVEQCARRDPLRASGRAGHRDRDRTLPSYGRSDGVELGHVGLPLPRRAAPDRQPGDKELDARADRLVEQVLALLGGTD